MLYALPLGWRFENYRFYFYFSFLFKTDYIKENREWKREVRYLNFSMNMDGTRNLKVG